MRGLIGSLQLLPLVDLAELVSRRRLSGALTCERGTVRKTIHLREGQAVGAASNDPREFLGQLLINFGHLTEEQLSKAFQTQEETRVRLGKVLTMVGLLPPELVREVLAIKIRETMLDVFTWDSGIFRLDDVPVEPGDDLDVAITLSEILREAEFRATAWQAFRAQFPTGAATLLIDESRIPTSAGSDTVDGKLLMLAVEGKTIDEIGLALRATDFHLYQRLYALATQGVLKPAAIQAGAARPAGEATRVVDLVEESRSLLAAGRTDEAAEAMARAADLAPGQGPARAALAEAEQALTAELRARLLRRGRTPVLRVPRQQVVRLDLSAAEKYLLSRCDGSRELAHILETAPLRELATLRAFGRFVDSDIVELR